MLLVPLINMLRQTHWDAQITLVTRPAFGELLKYLGQIEEFASAENLVNTRWFAEEAPDCAPPWAHCDLLLSAVSNGKDAWANNARRSPARQVCFFDPRPPTDYPRHVTSFHRQQLVAQGIPLPPPPTSEPRPLGSDREDANSLRSLPYGRGSTHHRAADGAGGVVIHPGSGGRAKCWDWKNFVQLGEKLADCGYRCQFVLGEVERERWPHEVIRRIRDGFPTLMEPTLMELAKHIRSAKLYIGNDSGVTHVAGLLGVETLALFGASNAVQWSPVGRAVRVLQANTLEDLLVEEVWRVAREMLAT